MASAAAATAAASSGAVSLPLLALQEAKSHSVVVETRDGRTYRGPLLAVEAANGNVRLGKNICVDKSGYRIAMNETLIKGSEVTLVQLPPVIKNAPFLKADFIRAVKEKAHLSAAKGSGSGSGGVGKMSGVAKSSALAERAARRLAAASAGARGDGSSGADGAGGKAKGSAEGKSSMHTLSRRIKEARKGGAPITGGKRPRN